MGIYTIREGSYTTTNGLRDREVTVYDLVGIRTDPITGMEVERVIDFNTNRSVLELNVQRLKEKDKELFK